MLRNFNLNVWPPTNPGALIRLGLGLLVAANLVAGYFVIRPIGGSPEELRQQATEMRKQIRQQQGALDRLRLFASKVEGGRGEGEHFMAQYFLPRRTAFSTLLAELNELEVQAKVTPKDSANVIERVEGSDTLAMMQMTLTFEGGYAELIRFVNMVDKSKRFLIMESLNATPQQGGAKLNVMLKLDTFVVEDGSEL